MHEECGMSMHANSADICDPSPVLCNLNAHKASCAEVLEDSVTPDKECANVMEAIAMSSMRRSTAMGSSKLRQGHRHMLERDLHFA